MRGSLTLPLEAERTYEYAAECQTQTRCVFLRVPSESPTSTPIRANMSAADAYLSFAARSSLLSFANDSRVAWIETVRGVPNIWAANASGGAPLRRQVARVRFQLARARHVGARPVHAIAVGATAPHGQKPPAAIAAEDLLPVGAQAHVEARVGRVERGAIEGSQRELMQQ